MESKFACKDCIHTRVCGDSGCYTDATRCTNFVCHAESRAHIDEANEMATYWRHVAEDKEGELARLRAFKKAVELIFGREIDI